MTTESLTRAQRKIGELDCLVLDAPGCDEQIRTVVVLCHGFGAPGQDLVPCAAELWQLDRQGLRHVRFVFPAAPIELDPGGMYDSRAWWPIDMLKLQQMMETGEVRDLRTQRPGLLDTRSSELRQLLERLLDETGLQYRDVVLGGFSQGAMLATEVALSLPEKVGGLVIWSGTLLSENQWRDYVGQRSGLRVLQSHGKLDPILPYRGAGLLRDLLTSHGNEVEFIEFDGPHTIPAGGIRQATRLIADVARNRTGQIRQDDA